METNDMLTFNNAVHDQYSRNSFRPEELEFARALDGLKEGIWMRNPVRGEGYGIPLPIKVGSSSTFYSDFIWWVGERTIALDPTGDHIFESKVRTKLPTLNNPEVVLVAKGRIKSDWTTTEDPDGYTVARTRKGRAPAPEYFQDLKSALQRIGGLSGG